MKKSPGPDRFSTFVLISSGFSLLAITVAYFKIFQENRDDQIQSLVDQGNKLVSMFENTLKMREATLADLVPCPEKGGYRHG